MIQYQSSSRATGVIIISCSSLENVTANERVYDGLPSEISFSANSEERTNTNDAHNFRVSEVLSSDESDDSTNMSLFKITSEAIEKESLQKSMYILRLAEVDSVEEEPISLKDHTTARTCASSSTKLDFNEQTSSSWTDGEAAEPASMQDPSWFDPVVSHQTIQTPTSMALNFRRDTWFLSLRRQLLRNMSWETVISDEQRSGKTARMLLDGKLDVTLAPFSWVDLCIILKMVIISGSLVATFFSFLAAYYKYRREWWFQFIRGGLLWGSPWFASISTTILFLGCDHHTTRKRLLIINTIVVYTIANSAYFFKYWLDLQDRVFGPLFLCTLSSIIICPWTIIKCARLTKLCKFKWMIAQLVGMYSVCSYLLHLIILSLDIKIAMIFCSAIPFVSLVVKTCAKYTIQKMLIGTVDNKLLVTFFAMLWNVNLEGVRFLSYVALMIQAMKFGWKNYSILLVVGNLMGNWIGKIWTLGGLRFLLMPKLMPCCWSYEGEILAKTYYSTRSVTEYTAPLVWMIMTIFDGIPICGGLIIPEKTEEQKEDRMLVFWSLCYENIFIILSVYIGCGVIADFISYRISLFHHRMTYSSVYRIDPPFLNVVLALINGYFLLYTYYTFSLVTENLLTRSGIIEI